MDGQRELLFLPLTRGAWGHEDPGSRSRVPGERAGEPVVNADLVQSGQPNAALIAAAPRMLDLLLGWIRAGEVHSAELQRETRELITQLEPASATWVSMGMRRDAGSTQDAAPPTSGMATPERQEQLTHAPRKQDVGG